MATRAEIIAARQTAGANYATAAQAYLTAYVELAAHDTAVGNSAIQGRITGGGFAALPVPNGHSEFFRDRVDANVPERVRARAAEIIDSLEG